MNSVWNFFFWGDWLQDCNFFLIFDVHFIFYFLFFLASGNLQQDCLFFLIFIYIEFLFFLTSIFLFPRRYVTRLWQWRAPPCHWPAAPWPSTTRSLAPPSPGNSSNRKWPPWAPKNDEVGIVCTGHILLCWEWGWGWCNFAKKNLVFVIMFPYLLWICFHHVKIIIWMI